MYKNQRLGKWRLAISWQDDDGRQHKMTRSTQVSCYEDKVGRNGKVRRDNRGRDAAEQLLRKWRDEEVRKDEELSGTVSCETPVYRYVLDYIDLKESTGNIFASTADGYRWYAKHLLGTELGKTPVGHVTARQIQEFERDMVQDGYGGNTVSHTHVLLKTAFIRARKLGDIPSNPFDLVDAPKRPTKPINSLDAQSVRQLNQTLGSVADPFSTAVLLALMTGMRQGEICALRWQDVDRVSRKIRVSHALTRANGTFALSTPKPGAPLGPSPTATSSPACWRRGHARCTASARRWGSTGTRASSSWGTP
ncbi:MULTISPECIES: tyrosine-type recombinase/integrase [Atopobiaceae]|uniref:Phage integrase family protein n=1 Tax=Parafannyhessea umbonata TaxID=604330 RepID=A0A1H6JF63_9ACTN|nr:MULTISPECIES: tyrosine-type recombinase/integrase [Atopobiaceae]SEH60903.1 Phage integrase family protein [Parafannyhessea umbonata]